MKTPVAEVVTTNYDQLFEVAYGAVGRTPSVLPHAIRPDAKRWVLKMHGCVSHPEDIVLTRRDYLGYAKRRAAAEGPSGCARPGAEPGAAPGSCRRGSRARVMPPGKPRRPYWRAVCTPPQVCPGTPSTGPERVCGQMPWRLT